MVKKRGPGRPPKRGPGRPPKRGPGRPPKTPVVAVNTPVKKEATFIPEKRKGGDRRNYQRYRSSIEEESRATEKERAIAVPRQVQQSLRVQHAPFVKSNSTMINEKRIESDDINHGFTVRGKECTKEGAFKSVKETPPRQVSMNSSECRRIEVEGDHQKI